MDVEKRTTITAGLNAEPMKQGLRELDAETRKTANSMTQSVEQISRALLGPTRGFDQLQRKFVDGYKDAMTYVSAIQTASNAHKMGRDSLESYQTILGGLNRQFGVMGTAALDAATKMLTAGKNVAQYKEGLQELILVMRTAGQVAAQPMRAPNLPGLNALGDFGESARRARAAADPYEQRMRAQYQADVQTTLNRFAGMRTPEQAKDAAESASVFTVELDKQRAAIDSVFRVSKQYEMGMEAIVAAVDSYAISAKQGAVLQEQLTKAFAAANGPIATEVVNYDKLRASIDSVYASSKAYEAELAKIDQLQAAGMSPGQADRFRDQAQQRFATANKVETQAEEYDRLRRSIDPVYKASKEYEEELKRVDETSKRLNYTHQQTEAAQLQVTQAFARSHQPMNAHVEQLHQMTGATGQQQFAMRQLGVQSVQTFSGFATGQPIMMTLIQQGHQVVDVMLSAGVSFRTLAAGVGTAIASFGSWLLRNPLTLIAAGIAAAVATITFAVVRAEQAQSRLLALGEQISAQRPGQGMAGAEMVDAAARHLAATTPLSREGAFDAGAVVARTRLFTGTQQQLEDLIKLGENLRIKLGIELPEAMKMLTDAAKEPGKAAEDAGQKFATFTTSIVQQISQLEKEGRLKEAIELFFRTMKEATSGASENVSNLTKQWERFQELATGDKAGLWRSLGNAMADGLAIGLKAMNDVIAAIREWKASMADWEDIPLTRKWWEKKLFGGASFTPTVGADVTKQMHDWLSAPGAQPTGLSSAGAMGIMQLMPRTAGGLGVNPMIPSENVMGGLKYIQQLSEQMKSFPGGLEPGVSRAYVAGPHGNLLGGEATSYAEKVAAADISRLPSDTVGLIDYWGKVLGLTPQQINLGKRIAMVENAGMQLAPSNQFKVVPGQTSLTPPAPAVVAPPATPTTPTATTTGFDTNKEEQLKRDLEQSNELARQQRENLLDQGRLRESITMQEEKVKQAQASGNQERIKQEEVNLANLRQRLMTLQGLYTDLIEQSQRMARDAENAAKAFDTQAGAARDFEQIRQKYRDIARQTGRPFDDDAANREIAAKQKELSKGFDDATEALRRQNEAQAQWLPFARQGSIALEEHVHQLQAEEEARKAAIPGSAEYNRLVKERVEALNQEAQVRRGLQIANDNYQQQQNIDFLKEEIALIGQSVAVRNRELAILRARQSLQLKPGQEPRDAGEAEKIKLAGEQADVMTEAERIQAAYREIEQTGQQVFDTIGDAIVSSFQEGADAAKIWQNALTSILNDIMKEFMKLAIINPLMNELFGSNRPEIGDAGGLLGKLFGGGGGDKSGSGGRDYGLIGKLFGLGGDGKSANDNLANKALNAAGGGLGGLPIDPITNAMRVVNVRGLGFGGSGTDDGTGALKNAAKQSTDSGGGLLDTLTKGIGSLFSTKTSDFITDLTKQDQGDDGSGGGLFSSIGKALFGGDSSRGGGGGGLFNWIGNLFSNSSGGGLFNWLGNLFSPSSPGGSVFGALDGKGLYHSGGLVGMDAVPMRMLPQGLWDTAPHYQAGLGANEFAAVLHRGERVLTANQNDRLESVMGRVAGGEGGHRGGGGNVYMTVNTPNADSFRNSQTQISSRMTAGLNRSQQRSRT